MTKFNMINKFLLTVLTLCISMQFVQAQDYQKEGEKQDYRAGSIADSLEIMQMEIYSIMEEYPEMKYSYKYEGDEMMGVEITGISNEEEAKNLEELLMTLGKFQNEITNVVEVREVYYVSDEEPEPKMGYDDFYDKIYSNLVYPDEAQNQGVEGTVYVNFVVDQFGNVDRIKTKTNIDAQDYIVEELKRLAKEAIQSTSGDWEPATLAGEPVNRWMMIPIEYRLKTNPYLRRLYPFSE